jgi:primosomal protein N' (replication factor Y)
MPLVRVAVPIPLPRDESLVYEYPEDEELLTGLRVVVPVGPRRVWGTVLGIETKRPEFRVRPIAGIPEPRLVLTPELLDLCRWVADYYAVTLGEVLQAAAPPPTALRRRTSAAGASPADAADTFGWHATDPPRRDRLNEAQLEALLALEASLDGGSADATGGSRGEDSPASTAPGGETAAPLRPFLLHGVTGSGKTAVYLHAAMEAIRRGGQALILVPEIALSPQALDAFRRAGLERTALYHSTLKPRERAEVWRLAAAGSLDLVVGTRSAVFLPFRNLRFVAVDEEQEGAYKQQDAPRYHARDVALVRAKRLGATIVLSSATPSLETYAQMNRGAYRLLHLPHRIDRRALATVRVADLRIRARAPAGREALRSPILSAPLLEAMDRTLAQGEQAILFLNRRGHSTYLQCRGCGTVARCTRCDVAYTVHADEAALRCHYCGAQRRLAPACTGCGASDLWFGGVGIQKVEREVRRLFPASRVARLDLDAARRRGAAGSILRSFREGRTDFLLGTQMVAKGFDFPGVTLVGIILADLQLFLPDFRAAERTFQILTQVAGRAGRGERPGEVVMQSYNPEHPILRFAADQDYAAFFRHESVERRELAYPPYGRLVEVEVRGKGVERVMAGCDRIAATLARAAAGLPVEILGPAPKPLARLKGFERWHLLLRSASRRALRTALERGLPGVRSLGLPGLRLTVDVDPQQLL